jgi:hypothetical protein
MFIGMAFASYGSTELMFRENAYVRTAFHNTTRVMIETWRIIDGAHHYCLASPLVVDGTPLGFSDCVLRNDAAWMVAHSDRLLSWLEKEWLPVAICTVFISEWIAYMVLLPMYVVVRAPVLLHFVWAACLCGK